MHLPYERTETWRRRRVFLIPIRCFTCGAVVADRLENFAAAVRRGEDPGKVLDDLGIKRYCCRRMLLANVDVVDEVLRFYARAREESTA